MRLLYLLGLLRNDLLLYMWRLLRNGLRLYLLGLLRNGLLRGGGGGLLRHLLRLLRRRLCGRFGGIGYLNLLAADFPYILCAAGDGIAETVIKHVAVVMFAVFADTAANHHRFAVFIV